MLQKTRDVDDVLEDRNTQPELAERLRLAQRIRKFAIHRLHLPESDSYTIYADLERNYAVKNLFAAEEFSVLAHRWCYLIIGCAGYRGYFDEQKLNDYVITLKQKNFDVYVANVSAYSTLGWFDDPLLNTFIFWPEPRLAGLIFHELSHQRLYMDGDTRFNESFAVAVQQAGVVKWLQATGQPLKLKQYQQYLVNRQQVVELIGHARENLQLLYQKDMPEVQKRIHKQLLFRQLKQDYKTLSASFDVNDGFKYWFADELNNAQLVSVSTYYTRVPAFRNLLQSHDDDFESFYRHVERLADMSSQERNDCLDYWLVMPPQKLSDMRKEKSSC